MTNLGGSDGNLRVAFPSDKPVTDYEPTEIHWDYQYILLENLFSPLVEFGKHGALHGGIAEHADWVGDELRLTIRNGLKTENGTPITAADVVFSLKRLLVLSGNTHGNFKDLVCPGIKLKSVEDNCPDLTSDGNVVIIKTKKREQFLLPMLAAIDFAIIPKSSVDPKTLKIINYKETSGPYYVAKDDGNGHIELKLNPFSYHASKNIPQTVELVPELTAKASLEALLNNQVDLVTTIDAARADEVLPFAEKHSQFRLHETQNIRVAVLVFTERGIKELSSEERRYIGHQVREAFRTLSNNTPGYQPTDSFFPGLSDGALTGKQQTDILALNKLHGTKPKGEIKIGLLHDNNVSLWSNAIRKALPDAKCSTISYIPAFGKHSSIDTMPDAFIGATDTSFMEDINLISYSLNAGVFGLTKLERAEWLKKYMSIDDKEKRLKMLRNLEFDALSAPVLVPLVASPYTALVRKPWRFELSTYYANDPIWQITRD